MGFFEVVAWLLKGLAKCNFREPRAGPSLFITSSINSLWCVRSGIWTVGRRGLMEC